MVKIVVTGGSGFIGTNFVKLLLSCGHKVLNIDKMTYAANPMSLIEQQEVSGYSLSIMDICNTSSMVQAFSSFQPDWIANLAAESHVDRSIDEPGVFIQSNITGTFSALCAARQYWGQLSSDRKSSFRFLHVSTDEVYGALGETGSFSESTRYDPHSPYSASKAASDHLARAWNCTYGLPVLVTNCSNNYGPYQFPEKLIPVVILKALRGESIPVYGTGSNVRDWLYVEDHCRALLAVLEGGRVGETYNIGGDNEMQNICLVQRLCEILDRLRPRDDHKPYESLIRFVTDRPGHDFRYAIDASKIRQELGWKPLQDNTSGFEKTVQWYLNNAAWYEPILSGTYQLQRQGAANAIV